MKNSNTDYLEHCNGIYSEKASEEDRLIVAHFKTEFRFISEVAKNLSLSSDTDPEDFRVDMVNLRNHINRFLGV